MAFVYSCCFWFSLRLGGILIGFFSLLQGVLALVACSVARSKVPELQNEITHILNNMKLIYTKEYLEAARNNPDNVITFGICLSCFYIFLCLLYIYGAYTCNNMLMIGFILAELARLLALSLLVATWLLVLKQNTMDIGLLIGASVGSGFFLLGIFYLWVCAANLPVLINEMERDEQAETITRLRRLLEENPNAIGRTSLGMNGFSTDSDPYGEVFTVPRRRIDTDKQWLTGSRAQLPFYR